MAGRWGVLVVVLLGLGALTPAAAQQRALQGQMREKLTHAQGLLDALVRGDFPMIASHADALSRVSETEIGTWQTPARPEYTALAVEFVQAVAAIRASAAARDLDDALGAYTKLVSSCTRCHEHVRSQPRKQAGGRGEGRVHPG